MSNQNNKTPALARKDAKSSINAVKESLAKLISEKIESENLSVFDVCDITGIAQPQVSKIKRLIVEKISLELLMSACDLLEIKISIGLLNFDNKTKDLIGHKNKGNEINDAIKLLAIEAIKNYD